MADEVQRISDLLSAPMEQIIVSLGTGIARAQRELDRYSLQSQREIAEDPLLSESGLQPTFYQIPAAELELTMAIALEEQPPTATRSLAAAPIQSPVLKQIHLQPINASYANQFSFDVNASSKLKLKIVPVPPPGADAAITPALTRDKVVDIAAPKLATAKDARLTANFNGQARTWFVLQYRLEGDTVNRLALVVVGDTTGQIIKSDTAG